MSWLDEIDNDSAENPWDGIHTKHRMKRMARVIRELARTVVVYRGALLSSNLGAQAKVHEENILSPDAKELLDG